jgi:uncharacterized damage-inducible protein DinB
METSGFHGLFAYDDWANRETLGSIKSRETPPPRSLKLMAHIISAQFVWHARLQRTPQPMAVWPELDLDESTRQLPRLKEMWQQYLAELDKNRFNDPIAYTNTKGERYYSQIVDVLTHVIMHSVYHRGQIASDIRAGGGEPAYTDFIHAVRQGFITLRADKK